MAAKIITRDNTMSFGTRGCPMFTCSECGKKFQKKAMAQSHILNAHGQPTI